MIRNNFNSEVIKLIVDKFVASTISSRIMFLGNHGSSLYKKIEQNSESDIDLELVLSVPEIGDYLEILKLLKQIPVKIECQLRYYSEFENNQLVDLSNYKLFMYFEYANGITLIGKNVYKEISERISSESYAKSLLISMQIAYKDIRKAYLGGGSAYLINKQVVRFFLCFAFYSGLVDYRKLGTEEVFSLFVNGDVIDVVTEAFSDYFSTTEQSIIHDFKKCLLKNEIDERIFVVVNNFANMVPTIRRGDQTSTI
ncbi:MAG: hypothetical protein NT098_05280 [Candidatus Parcubacteria bacterium]|nr:hypothetical protein [Candidatus Parcubacteria bacterium]